MRRKRYSQKKFTAAVVAFEGVSDATESVYEIMGSGLVPAALELLDGETVGVITGRMEDGEFVERMNRAYDEIVSYAISVGGTATGEHGVGIGKKRFMVQEHGEGVEVMRRIKNLLDPNRLDPRYMGDC